MDSAAVQYEVRIESNRPESEMNSVDMGVINNPAIADTIHDDHVLEMESPDHVRPNTQVNGTVSPLSSPNHVMGTDDLILSNPALAHEGTIKGGGVTLAWKNLCVDVQLPQPGCIQRMRKGTVAGPQKKAILTEVNGKALPGSLLAIMGASGAGKTTFLNVLSYQNMDKLEVNGDITINGKNIKSKIKSLSAYVQQQDLFIGTLTVKEHLTFQALLRMGKQYTTEQKKQRVKEVMNQLGLMKCSNTIIGVPGRIKGISGGENKRLSFASEIITNPNLLFVDEPTSGLDSFMAESVITALQDIAKEGKTILATIHQPSSEVFQLFDRLLLMSEGRTAFLGSTDNAIEFFNTVGYPCPMNYNPADHYVHVLAIMPGDEQQCRKKAAAICDHYNTQDPYRNEKVAPVIDSDVVPTSRSAYKSGFFQQLKSVLWRSWQANSREPYITTMRISQALIIAIIAGLVYLRQDNDHITGAENLNGAIFFCITTLTFNSLSAALFVFPAEFPVFIKEHKLGMYRTSVYFLSKTLAELPWYVVSTFIFSAITYWMVGLKETAAAFFIFCGLMQLVTQCALSFGYFVSAISPTVQVATSMGPPLIMPFMLFGGFFIKDESVPDYFIWLKWVSWFKYSNENLQVNQWEDHGAFNCKVNTTCATSGLELLNRNDYNPDNFNRNIGLLMALLIGFRLFAYIIMVIKARRAR